jgi:hypothetical protein
MLHSSYNSHIQSHWGKKTWDSIFLLAADFPHEKACKDDESFTKQEVAQKRRAWKKFFETLPDILSCEECGYHFQRYLEREGGVPFRNALRDRESLFAWLHRCKDEINKRTKRKSISLKKTKKKYIARCDRGMALPASKKASRK